MPLYEYECENCGRFEKIQKFSARPLKTCPTCGKKGLERLLSAPAIQFKGSGWYITDYARKGSGDGKAAQGDGAKKKDKKSDGAGSSEASSTPKTSTDSSAASGTRAS